ncbi:hypothetical protein NM208_g5822 [Fusarium decemcellulare]|uniref:Uncharacterized protein n=2 Tax=Fusarium decemcellulare TaxID=57161 RepID=A0ACC1SFF1_9HYPO|nr:hypothetical protein NM208_g6831 [Fusarium decemcellulare]KAJ3538627.1 hypothetical protein NM208_g5822 [Fusarium decemcellulare]
MNSPSPAIDHDFEFEEMLHFPWDETLPRTFGPSPTTWPNIPLPSEADSIKSWDHFSDEELAEKLLPDAKSPNFEAKAFYFRILREWLLNCDSNHDECQLSLTDHEFWPKRVIFVGDHQHLRLVEEPSGDRDYLVLSHCWGSPTDQEWNRFCTTPNNYHSRLDGFRLDDLPKTFRDAVEVTRELGKQYLWIDALCIIQGSHGEWQSEASRMERVFANAYCTIAADSARGWKDGFLEPSLWDQIVPGSMECDCRFDLDVDEGSLMKRAWVIQERVLSRRIIHFTASHTNVTHTYWECGDEVRCQQFSKLSLPIGKQRFIMDPYFPSLLMKAGYYRSLEFIQFLLGKYSQCGLTYKSDRDMAISSLLGRMGHELATSVRYGIIRCFLGSLLSWKRTAKEMTPPIDFGQRTVPSWSWMAYDGSIEFIVNYRYELEIPRPTDLEFTQDGKELKVKVREFENCRLGENEGDNEYAVCGRDGKVGSLWYDMKGQIEFNYCVVVGSGKTSAVVGNPKTYYVVMVQEKPDRGCYVRLGAGTLDEGYVSTKSEAGRLL